MKIKRKWVTESSGVLSTEDTLPNATNEDSQSNTPEYEFKTGNRSLNKILRSPARTLLRANARSIFTYSNLSEVLLEYPEFSGKSEQDNYFDVAVLLLLS